MRNHLGSDNRMSALKLPVYPLWVSRSRPEPAALCCIRPSVPVTRLLVVALQSFAPAPLQVSLVSTLRYPHGNGIVNSIMMYAASMCPAPQPSPGWILAERARETQRVHMTRSVPLYWRKDGSGSGVISHCFTIFSIGGWRQRVDAKEEVESRACKISEARWGR